MFFCVINPLRPSTKKCRNHINCNNRLMTTFPVIIYLMSLCKVMKEKSFGRTAFSYSAVQQPFDIQLPPDIMYYQYW